MPCRKNFSGREKTANETPRNFRAPSINPKKESPMGQVPGKISRIARFLHPRHRLSGWPGLPVEDLDGPHVIDPNHAQSLCEFQRYVRAPPRVDGSVQCSAEPRTIGR